MTEIEICKQVARGLGYSCRVQSHGAGALLVGPDDEQLMIRWNIAGSPNSLLIIGRIGPTTPNPRITLSVSKGPELILREIQNRLMPDYREALKRMRQELQEQQARHLAYEALVKTHGSRHLAITGLQEHLFWSSAPDVRATVELDKSGMIGDLILNHLSISAINAILTLLRNLGEASETGGIPIQTED